jgi:hypothetical protein
LEMWCLNSFGFCLVICCSPFLWECWSTFKQFYVIVSPSL